MGESVVINPSGDFHPSSQAVVSLEAGDSGVVVSKKSTTYVCSFCDRVCRNAQALGGHMNVHRRERTLAKQLVNLRNQKGENLKGTSAATTGFVVAAAAAAAASGNPPTGEGEQDHQQEEVITHGGSSASSSSPPSPHSIAIASALVLPRRSLQRLPSKIRKHREAVDLELRLGFTPGRLL